MFNFLHVITYIVLLLYPFSGFIFVTRNKYYYYYY